RADREARATLNADRFGDPLNQYRDLFPAQLGDEARTDRGRMLGELAGRQPPPPPSASAPPIFPGPQPKRPSPPPAAVKPPPALNSSFQRGSFARGRSFVGMRGFARVGGVLIGRDLNEDDPSGPSLDVRDLSWEEIDKDTVKLTLTLGDGSKV